MSGARRWAGWVVIAVVVVGLLAFGSYQRGPQSDAARAQALDETIRCPQCSGESVAASDAPIARSIRNTVSRMVAQGQSDEQIRDYLSSPNLYGQEVLLDPVNKGFGALVWGVPVAALVITAAAVTLKFGDWQRRGNRHTTAADRSLVEEARRGAGADPS
ncbi:MAG TPA: cytochrome c-type biogenesis protein [Acidimicrobiales bacterium]